MRILLSSDLHLGMKFAGYPEVQAILAEARFQCLTRVVAAANEAKADLLVVAGDLFERVSMPRRDVQRAADALRGFSGRLAAVLPGNHDYIAPDDGLWPSFSECCAGSALVLGEPRPYPLSHYDLDACLYPAPCTAKHSAANAVGWVRPEARVRDAGLHLGIAHGSLEGFSPDMAGSYYPMRPQELLAAGMDAWLLGHTHLRFPQSPGPREVIFCAGTPEPDGFDCGHEGFAWLIDLSPGQAVSARPIRTGDVRFIDSRVQIEGQDDLERLQRAYEGGEGGRTMLRLRLSGRISQDAFALVGALRERLSKVVLNLDLRTDELREQIDAAAIDRDYPPGSFPHSLLSLLLKEDDQEALVAASELLQEMRR